MVFSEVYSAQTLDELFVPAHPLVSAPGTIIHPVTNVNAPFYAVDERAYVMPAPTQPQFTDRPPITSLPVRDVDQDDDEDNWDRWDGFPASSDNVGVSTITGAESAGRGRDNPYFQAGDEDRTGEDLGSGLPYYYDNYARYSQPPPGYEDLTK